MPLDVEITLAVDTSTGNFTYTPSTAYASRGQNIKWTSDSPFAVFFAETPFDHCHMSSVGTVLEAKVRNDAPSRQYKYAVGIFKGDKVRIDSCPEIIIPPPK